MPLKLFLVIPLFFAIPSLSVNWSDPAKEELTIRITAHDPVLTQCQKSGLEVSYRFDLKLCKPRLGWFSKCKDARRANTSFRWDPISETYKVFSDLLDDSEQPASSSVASFDEALEEISTLKGLSLDFLAEGDKEFVNSNKIYLSGKVSFTCKGQSSKTLDRISSVLTLGLVSVGSSNSGWIDFNLGR